MASNEWKVTSRASSVITATWVFQGLWMDCAGNALGYIQACRGLMIAAICLGFFGSICALVGMKCTKIGGSEQTKSRIACLAGLIFILCGLCAMTSCSLYANRITVEFFDPLYVAQKYELGAALFIGWAGSSLCIIGGSIFCFSLVKDNKNRRVGYAYNTAASAISTRTKAYNDSTDFKAPNASPKHFDKNAYV
ncbi:PREDICTED: claudin-10 isoform X4 [Gekko japonicus]|uniref:Claudin-10 isoform X4 n=1 Tax=Gekko japonicus TaxID=146911 RepID=A0ABM1KFY6_GEKJA|nr:PREDICTED: claudin-10 isoform X4 [Gekko japonicus]